MKYYLYLCFVIISAVLWRKFKNYLIMKSKPCPFCCNTTTDEYDARGACCFYDYDSTIKTELLTVPEIIERFGHLLSKKDFDNIKKLIDKT